MKKFVIETGIPIPERSFNEKYPFNVMKIGNSFRIKGYDKYRLAVRAAHEHSRRHQRKIMFRSRWNKLNHEGRIWRIK